jgi:hypothetical protein
MKQIENEFKLLKEYMNLYIDLLPYTHTKEIKYIGDHKLDKYEIPSFEEFKKENIRWTSTPLQCTMIIRNNKIVNLYNGTVFVPQGGDWLYYYRYNTFHMCPFNKTKRIVNKELDQIKIEEGNIL